MFYLFFFFLFYVLSLIYGFLKQQKICCKLSHFSLFTIQIHLNFICREDIFLVNVLSFHHLTNPLSYRQLQFLQ
jgi:hypothetical protein